MYRIIAKRTLRTFWEKNPQSEQALKTWYHIVKNADWTNSNEVKKVFLSASIVGDNRIVFNIKGNHFRLVVKFNFERKWVFIRFVGTHKDYDKIDVKTI
ncbi:MAG: type II toxin-antitoxin system HigB family toxin [Bacteroidia bacterium]